MASTPVQIHHVIPKSVFEAFEVQINEWTNGEFKLDAAYNLVPMADNAVSAAASGSGMHFGSHQSEARHLLAVFPSMCSHER